jgi:dTDP-4-dehydrorhamnose 3,5-epimerase
LRGLHFQKHEFAQAKLVRVVFGRVLDVVVDLRKEKSTFGKYFSTLLDADTKRLLMVPRGFAHGFVVLSEQATFQYKVDNVYNAGSEGGIIFDDATLSIDWMIPQKDLILSEKDRKLQSFLDWKKSS